MRWSSFAFYLDSEVLMSFRGFGLPYHLARTSDLIVWLAFVIGDLNFIAAGIAAFYLIRHRRTYLRPTSHVMAMPARPVNHGERWSDRCFRRTHVPCHDERFVGPGPGRSISCR
jgi:hypothetical protein